MSLKGLLPEQVEQIRSFVLDENAKAHVVRVDPDLTPMVVRLLARIDDDPENMHIMTLIDAPYQSEDQFCAQINNELVSECANAQGEMAALGIALPQAGSEKAKTPLIGLQKFLSDIVQSISLPNVSLLLIVNPSEIQDDVGFGSTISSLVKGSKDSARYLVIDRRKEPRISDEMLEQIAATHQEFQVDPAEIEKRVLKDLENGNLSKPERGRYLAMAGSFAQAHHRLPEAETYQLQALALVKEHGAPAEQAALLYNLGNTQLEAGKVDQAVDAYSEGAQICLDSQSNALLAMIMTNLGVALGRKQQLNESIASLDVAQKTFSAVGNKPGEAYALDCKAHVLAEAGKKKDAEDAWLGALSIYDQITAKEFADVRNAGRKDIRTKLERFYLETKQPAKVASLPAA